MKKHKKIKKIPYYLLVGSLAMGASLILGFLSFGGMYVLAPILPLAFAAFALSVAYEGEIYLQNVQGALRKLFKPNYLKNYLAREYLLTHFPQDLEDKNCPQFFRDYAAQVQLLSEFSHKNLNARSRMRKQNIERTLKDMEKWFANQLFANVVTEEDSEYQLALAIWLMEHEQDHWQQLLQKRLKVFNGLKIFSLFAGVFMTLGTSYLIVEAFSVIPFFMAIPFALWPVIIAPMAIIAGAAYCLLTYNAVTDMVNNDTIVKWYRKLKNDWRTEGFTGRNVFMTITATLLVALTVTLTICTAGTWWTVASNARPLFQWMGRMPQFIMGIINPIITGLSAVVFNFQNTAETLDLIEQATHIQPGFWHRIGHKIHDIIHDVAASENILQILNPFRIILKLTILPLRIIFFLGHLVSIGATADRMPGVPEIAAAIISIISEGFEDAHYFVGHDHDHHDHHHHHHHHEHEHHHHHHHEHEHVHVHDLPTLLNERLSPAHSHNHDVDLPTRLIKLIFLPVYLLAALWDYCASRPNVNNPNRPALSISRAWAKHIGTKDEVNVELDEDAIPVSQQWQEEHAVALIDKYQEKHLSSVLIGKQLAQEKSAKLDEYKALIRAKVSVEEALEEAQNQPIFKSHRFFTHEKAKTQEFIEDLAVITAYPTA